MILRWVSDKQDDCFLKGLCCLSTPYDLQKCIDKMGKIF